MHVISINPASLLPFLGVILVKLIKENDSKVPL